MPKTSPKPPSSSSATTGKLAPIAVSYQLGFICSILQLTNVHAFFWQQDANSHIRPALASLANACQYRTKYLNQTLVSLTELPGLDQMTVYISQDGTDAGVSDLVQAYAELLRPPHTAGFEHWQHPRVPLLGDKQVSIKVTLQGAPLSSAALAGQH